MLYNIILVNKNKIYITLLIKYLYLLKNIHNNK